MRQKENQDEKDKEGESLKNDQVGCGLKIKYRNQEITGKF